MGLRGQGRAAAPVLGNLLLVGVVLILGITLTLLSFTFLESTGTPTAEATFDFEETPAGVNIVPTALGQPVTVQLNGREIARLTSEDTGIRTFLPTAPGDEITIVSRDEDRSVLVRERVDDRSEVGDFVTYYTFASGSGDTVVDRSRNDNDGRLEDDSGGSGPTWTGGSCLSFDGQDDYVTVSDITVGGVDAVESFTVATTVRIDGATGDRQQFVEHSFGGNEWFLETIDASPPFSVGYAVNFPSEVITASDTLATGDTAVVVGTYDGRTDEYELYVDGRLVASDTFDRSVEMGKLRLGRDFESAIQYLDGRMCEFRLYYTAFDPASVGTLTTAMR